jgi:serine protease Do
MGKTILLTFILLFCCIITLFAVFVGYGLSDKSAEIGFIRCEKLSDLETYPSAYRDIVCSAAGKNSCYYQAFDCASKTNNSSNSSSTTSTNSTNTSTSKSTSSASNTSNPLLTNLQNESDGLVSLVDQVNPSVVTIVAKYNSNDFWSVGSEESQNIGSGFVIRSDGLIITNSHVVSGDYEYSVLLPGETKAIAVTEINKDVLRDIAILKIDKKGLTALKLGDSSSLKRGETVIAIGSPLGTLTGSVSRGIISGLNRDVEISDNAYSSSTRKINGVIQTDAAINPGNSGGPLINLKGEVIGVNFATTTSANNISFAIPVDTVNLKLAEYEKYGKFLSPYIGIAFDTRSNGVIGGAYVLQVGANSPAEKAGLQKSDLIMKADGKDLETDSLLDIIQSKKIGEKIQMSIWRKGETVEVEVEVIDRPAN